MTECLETVSAMIAPHATAPFATKWQMMIGYVYNGVVDAHATRLGVINHVTSTLVACCEVVQSQGCGVRVDVLDTIVDVVEGNDGQYGTKNFVGEQWRIAMNVGDECGRDVALLAIGNTTGNDSAVREKCLETVEVTEVDNARIVGA